MITPFPDPTSTAAQAAQAGFEAPVGSASIRDGDNAITKNARRTVDWIQSLSARIADATGTANSAGTLALALQSRIETVNNRITAIMGDASPDGVAASERAAADAADAAAAAAASAADAADAAALVGSPAGTTIDAHLGGDASNLVATANAALARATIKVSDAGLWISPFGSDSNDGLSPGAARLTPTTAAQALPATGGTINLLGGTHVLTAALPNRNKMRLVGQGRAATTLRVDAGNLIAPTSTPMQNLHLEGLELRAKAGHLIDLGSTTGGLANSAIVGCSLVTDVAGSSLISGSGQIQFLGVKIEDCLMTRLGSATVPAVNLTSSAGAINSNVFDTITPYGNFCSSSPFFRIEATLGAYAHDNTFRNIIGEQNTGGLIHIYSPNGVIFDAVVDWDAGATSYADHLVKVDTSATSGGKVPLRVSARVVGTRFGTMSAGMFMFWCPSLPGDAIKIESIGDPAGSQPAQASSRIIGASIRDSSGATGSIREQVASYTLSHAVDGTVVFTGSTALTATLPASSTVPYFGRRFTVVNGTTQPLTLNASGGLLVGDATSQTVTAGSSMTVAYYNSRWWKV